MCETSGNFWAFNGVCCLVWCPFYIPIPDLLPKRNRIICEWRMRGVARVAIDLMGWQMMGEM